MNYTLPERFKPPKDWQWVERLETRPGQFIRYGLASPEKPKAIAFIQGGFSEYSEKYFETARDCLSRNFAVSTMDWRGQGLSWRDPRNAHKRYHNDFARDVEDTVKWVDAVSANPAYKNLPKILIAHSMGGHIALRAMHDHKDLFNVAALNAPMQGLQLPHEGQGYVRALANVLYALGAGGIYAGGKPWSMDNFLKGLDNLGKDTDRRDMQIHWLGGNEGLRMGGVTIGWVRAAVNSMRLTNHPAYLAEILTPVLLTMAGDEKIVSNTAIERTAQLLPNAELVRIEGGLHEILAERDAYRNQFWHAFDGFVAKHL